MIKTDAMSRKELMAQLAKAEYDGPHSYTLRVLRKILEEETGAKEFEQLTGNRKAREIFGRPGVTGPRNTSTVSLVDVVVIRAKDDAKGTFHAHSVDCKTCNNSTMYFKADREAGLAHPTRTQSRRDVVIDVYGDVATDSGPDGSPEWEAAIDRLAEDVFFHTCLKDLA